MEFGRDSGHYNTAQQNRKELAKCLCIYFQRFTSHYKKQIQTYGNSDIAVLEVIECFEKD